MSTALASVEGMTEAHLNSTDASEFPFRANVFSLPARREMRPHPSGHLTQALENDTQIVGNSPALRRVLEVVKKVAPYDSTVLLLGETGTGKELIAQAIHTGSRRCDRPLVRVNCAALPAELIASELFGHEKGAFTGALQHHIG